MEQSLDDDFEHIRRFTVVQWQMILPNISTNLKYEMELWLVQWNPLNVITG